MSIVANPGFEDSLGPLQTVSPQPLYFGGWSPFQGYAAAPHQPTRVAGAGHSGSWGLHITASSGVGQGNWVLQDFPAVDVDPDNGVYLAAWVKPVTGNEQLQLALDYDRGPGTSAAVLGVDLRPTESLWSTWDGIFHTVAPISFGVWHQVALQSFPDGSSNLIFDGAILGATGPMTVPSFSVATILIGEGAGVFTPFTDDFYWDDVTLDFNPYPEVAARPLLRQRQRAL